MMMVVVMVMVMVMPVHIMLLGWESVIIFSD
jgi:hypothetical protein